MSKLLEGKLALILGIANKWSLAYSIAQAFSREGATLALTYLGDRQRRSEERRVGKECRSRWSPDHSSRRRHTRCLSDWSSDVCSSDLWSLAYSIAQAFSREGATLALTYLGDRQRDAIEDLSKDLNVAAILPC